MKSGMKLFYHNVIRDLKQPLIYFSTIVLSMILLLTAFFSVESFIEYRKHLSLSSTKNYDLAIFDVKYEDYSRIPEGQNINKIQVIKNLGYASLEENDLIDINYMYIQELTTESLKSESFILESGRLPKNDNEIIVPSQYASAYSKKVGDIVLYNIGFLKKDGYYSYQLISRILSDLNDEKIEFKKENEKIYTIVGIYQSSGSLYTGNSALTHYYAYSNLNGKKIENDAIVDVLFSFKDKSNIEAELTNYSDILHPHYSANVWARTTSNMFASTLKNLTYFIVIGFAIILIFLAINSSLEFGNNERKKYYTQLMSLGSTSKEIKRSWDLQVYLIALLAIPLGICFGLLIIFIFASMSLDLATSTSLIKSIISSKEILLSSLIVFFIVIIANRTSEEKILYSTPLESIKGSTESINAKFVHYGNITKLKGEIDKYVKSNFVLKGLFSEVFVVFFAVSISLLMTFISLNNTATEPIIDYIKNEHPVITLKIEGNGDYLDNLKDISKLDSVIDYSIWRRMNDVVGYIYGNNDVASKMVLPFQTTELSNIKIPFNLVSISDEEWAKMATSANITESIIVSPNFLTSSNRKIKKTGLLHEGDSDQTFKVYQVDGNGITDTVLSVDNYYVYGLIDERNNEVRPGYINAVIKDSVAESLNIGKDVKHNMITVTLDDETKFIENLNKYSTDKGFIINIINRKEAQLTNSYYINLSYNSGFILMVVLIILIFIIVFETMHTYVKSREKELGLLKSMGVSNSGLESVIRKEYGKNYTIACILGIILGFVVNKGISVFFVIDGVDYITKGLNNYIGFLFVIISLLIIFIVNLKICTKDLKNKYPIELLEDNFKEF